MNLQLVLEKIQKAGGAKLVAVSKNVTHNEILALNKLGQIDFGENKVQDLKLKSDVLSNLELKWHFIGRLQTNKINQLIKIKPFLWQSCDSLKMAMEVNKRLEYKLPTLLQINSANEPSKQGVRSEFAQELYLQILSECKFIDLCGVMSIGAMSDDKNLIKKSFEDTFKIYEKLIPYGAKICSMGMSSDFELAIKCGSNMVRLGSILYR